MIASALRDRGRTAVAFVRHGQATHNVRAEPLREAGCSFAAFLEQMREDDEVDSELTTRGIEQATEVASANLATQHQDRLCIAAQYIHCAIALSLKNSDRVSC